MRHAVLIKIKKELRRSGQFVRCLFLLWMSFSSLFILHVLHLVWYESLYSHCFNLTLAVFDYVWAKFQKAA